jgi:hypothetical protein
MILKVHLEGAASYDVGHEIWQETLADAIHAEAETIAGYAGSELLESPDQAHRDALRDRLVDEMTVALVSIGDRYRAPDGVLYSLIEESALGPDSGEGRLGGMATRASEPIVEAVLRFEDLPLGSAGTRPCGCSLERWDRRCGDDLVQRRDPRVRRRPRRKDPSRNSLASFPQRSRLAAVLEQRSIDLELASFRTQARSLGRHVCGSRRDRRAAESPNRAKHGSVVGDSRGSNDSERSVGRRVYEQMTGGRAVVVWAHFDRRARSTLHAGSTFPADVDPLHDRLHPFVASEAPLLRHGTDRDRRSGRSSSRVPRSHQGRSDADPA